MCVSVECLFELPLVGCAAQLLCVCCVLLAALQLPSVFCNGKTNFGWRVSIANMHQSKFNHWRSDGVTQNLYTPHCVRLQPGHTLGIETFRHN